MKSTVNPKPFPGDPLPQDPPEVPERRFLRYLVQGRGIKADLLLEYWADRLVVVKDYGKRGWLARILGRYQVRREARIYRALQGIPGVPPFLGILSRESLAVGHVPGRPIDQFQETALVGKILAGLRSLIDAIHERGVAHVDLRRRNNLLVDEEGKVQLIDFNGSIHLMPGTRAERWFFPWLKRIDEFAFLKWKQRLAPSALSRQELVRLRKISFLRAFWFFN